MLSYCLMYKKKTEQKRKGCESKNTKIILLSNCEVWNSIKSRFIREQEVSGLLSCLKDTFK